MQSWVILREEWGFRYFGSWVHSVKLRKEIWHNLLVWEEVTWCCVQLLTHNGQELCLGWRKASQPQWLLPVPWQHCNCPEPSLITVPKAIITAGGHTHTASHTENAGAQWKHTAGPFWLVETFDYKKKTSYSVWFDSHLWRENERELKVWLSWASQWAALLIWTATQPLGAHSWTTAHCYHFTNDAFISFSRVFFTRSKSLKIYLKLFVTVNW